MWKHLRIGTATCDVAIGGRQSRRLGCAAHRARTRVCVGVAAISLVATACNGTITNPYGTEGQLTSIEVLGPSSVQVGDTIRLTALGHVAGVVGILGLDRLPDATWNASDPSVVRLTPVPVPASDTAYAEAVVGGVTTGVAQITVSARGVSGSHAVRVVAGP